MNIELNDVVINEEYRDLLSFKNEGEKIEHAAQMISYKILSEIEKLCVEKQIKKKDLAQMVGTSRSYITQLFTGTKSINTQIMAKFENALNITFEIKLKLNEESYNEFLSKQIYAQVLNKCLVTPKGAWYYCDYKGRTDDIVNSLETESKLKQVA